MRNTKWIVECRSDSGRLDFSGAQPEDVFGLKAITGMSEDAMASVVYTGCPDVVLAGDSISLWPSNIDPRWTARRKTW